MRFIFIFFLIFSLRSLYAAGFDNCNDYNLYYDLMSELEEHSLLNHKIPKKQTCTKMITKQKLYQMMYEIKETQDDDHFRLYYDKRSIPKAAKDPLSVKAYKNNLYIQARSFNYSNDERKKLNLLKNEYETIYLDLRGNYGGYLYNAQHLVASILGVNFIPDSFYQYFTQPYRQYNRYSFYDIEYSQKILTNENMKKKFNSLMHEEYRDINRYVGEEKFKKRNIVIFVDKRCFSACRLALGSLVMNSDAKIYSNGMFDSEKATTDIHSFKLPYSGIYFIVPFGRKVLNKDSEKIINERIKIRRSSPDLNYALYIFRFINLSIFKQYMFFSDVVGLDS